MPIQACVSNKSWPDCYYTEKNTHLKQNSKFTQNTYIHLDQTKHST